jgi:hypothetical protein
MQREMQKLSPQARKALVAAQAGPVQALVELAPGASPATLAEPLGRLCADVVSWSAATRLLTLRIDAPRLGDLALLREVTYVQVGGGMRR